ncbi:hypothetical protein JCM8097_005096 [Rhodosporidiobolus ruineniae]
MHERDAGWGIAEESRARVEKLSAAEEGEEEGENAGRLKSFEIRRPVEQRGVSYSLRRADDADLLQRLLSLAANLEALDLPFFSLALSSSAPTPGTKLNPVWTALPSAETQLRHLSLLLVTQPHVPSLVALRALRSLTSSTPDPSFCSALAAAGPPPLTHLEALYLPQPPYRSLNDLLPSLSFSLTHLTLPLLSGYDSVLSLLPRLHILTVLVSALSYSSLVPSSDKPSALDYARTTTEHLHWILYNSSTYAPGQPLFNYPTSGFPVGEAAWASTASSFSVVLVRHPVERTKDLKAEEGLYAPAAWRTALEELVDGEKGKGLWKWASYQRVRSVDARGLFGGGEDGEERVGEGEEEAPTPPPPLPDDVLCLIAEHLVDAGDPAASRRALLPLCLTSRAIRAAAQLLLERHLLVHLYPGDLHFRMGGWRRGLLIALKSRARLERLVRRPGKLARLQALEFRRSSGVEVRLRKPDDVELLRRVLSRASGIETLRTFFFSLDGDSVSVTTYPPTQPAWHFLPSCTTQLRHLALDHADPDHVPHLVALRGLRSFSSNIEDAPPPVPFQPRANVTFLASLGQSDPPPLTQLSVRFLRSARSLDPLLPALAGSLTHLTLPLFEAGASTLSLLPHLKLLTAIVDASEIAYESYCLSDAERRRLRLPPYSFSFQGVLGPPNRRAVLDPAAFSRASLDRLHGLLLSSFSRSASRFDVKLVRHCMSFSFGLDEPVWGSEPERLCAPAAWKTALDEFVGGEGRWEWTVEEYWRVRSLDARELFEVAEGQRGKHAWARFTRDVQ